MNGSMQQLPIRFFMHFHMCRSLPCLYWEARMAQARHEAIGPADPRPPTAPRFPPIAASHGTHLDILPIYIIHLSLSWVCNREGLDAASCDDNGGVVGATKLIYSWWRWRWICRYNLRLRGTLHWTGLDTALAGLLLGLWTAQLKLNVATMPGRDRDTQIHHPR